MEDNRITLDKLVRWVGIVLLVAGVFFTMKYLSGVLLPFFVAWFFAYLLYPIVKFVQYGLRVKIRAIAIILTLLFVIGIIAGAIYLIIPPMIEEAEKVITYLSNYVTDSSHGNSIMDYAQKYMRENENELRRYLRSEEFATTVKEALPKVFNVLGETAGIVLSIIGSCITLLYMFFILLDYEYLTKSWIKIFPVNSRPFWRDVMKDVEHALNSYIRGQGTVALIMGILFCIGFTIIDFPMAIGFGILIGIMDLVPYLHTFALIPGAFLSMIKAAETGQSFWLVFGTVILIFAVVQIIIDMIVTPKVMGKAMGLNPAVLLLSLSVWGALLGFIGLIIALPLTTLIMAYWKRYVTKE